MLNTGDLLKGDLLNVDVNVDLDADLAAPINGAVAANANVAAPIDAVRGGQHPVRGLRVDRDRQQDAIITQSITGSAEATSDQVSSIDQGVRRAGRHRHRVDRHSASEDAAPEPHRLSPRP